MHVSHKYAPEQKIAPLGIKGNRKNNSDIVFFCFPKSQKEKPGASFRWSIRPNSALGSIETTSMIFLLPISFLLPIFSRSTADSSRKVSLILLPRQ